MTISDFTNELDIVVDRGDITLRPGTVPLARMDVQTRTGDITLSLPPAAKFDLTATTTRGDAENEFGSPLRTQNDGRGASVRGSVAGGPVVSVRTEHGKVDVRKSSPDDKPLLPKMEESRPVTAPTPTKPLKKIEQ